MSIRLEIFSRFPSSMKYASFPSLPLFLANNTRTPPQTRKLIRLCRWHWKHTERRLGNVTFTNFDTKDFNEVSFKSWEFYVRKTNLNPLCPTRVNLAQQKTEIGLNKLRQTSLNKINFCRNSATNIIYCTSIKLALNVLVTWFRNGFEHIGLLVLRNGLLLNRSVT